MSSPPKDDPGWLLKLIVDAANEVSLRLAGDIGLGATDFRAVDLLLAEGPVGPKELGDRLGLTPAAATALADRLERAGHVERVRGGEDRRRVALVPTEHAREEALRALEPFLTDIGKEVGALSAAERQVVAGFLQRVLDVHHRHGAGEGGPKR